MPPEPDPTAGRACIWAISFFLFICIAAGGGCLLAYMTVPESQSSNLLPILGFILVCMPWIFWITTIVYRITSRAFGFRMVIGSLYGNGSVSAAKGGGVGGADVGVNNGNVDGAQIVDVNNAESTSPSSPDHKKDDGFRNNIQSGNKANNNKDGVEAINIKGGRRSSSSSSSSDISHESQMPLALAL